MSTPAERLELCLDIAGQVEENNRAERHEQCDARVEWDPRDDPNYPTEQDLAEMAYWDRIADKREAQKRAAGRAEW